LLPLVVDSLKGVVVGLPLLEAVLAEVEEHELQIAIVGVKTVQTNHGQHLGAQCFGLGSLASL